MNILFTILILWCAGCAINPAPRLLESSSAAQPQSIVLPPQVALVRDANDPSYFAVNYSPGMDPSKFEWRAEASPDLQRWFYFYQFETNPIIYVPKFQPNTFVRLVGVPLPQP